MPSTRRSVRLASSQEDSSPAKPSESPKAAAGTKRKTDAGSSPVAKRGKKNAPKEQKTIEQTMDMETDSQEQPEPESESTTQPQNQVKEQESKTEEKEQEKEQEKDNQEPTVSKPNEDDKHASNGQHVDDKSTKQDGALPDSSSNDKTDPEPTADAKSAQESSKMDDTGAIQPQTQPKSAETKPDEHTTNGHSAIEPHARDDETSANILEKGLIYFFFRGRVGIDNASDVGDIARSYIVLRPIPHGAKIADGPISEAAGKCRLLALPKKVLPISGKDRFMTFVEDAKTSFAELKTSFLSGSDYNTQTAGVRHTPSVTPVAEGVYAITTTGRESHLAYSLTIPQELGDVQKDMGLRDQGSFVTSVKNPQYAGPANTNLPEGPKYTKEIFDEFRSLRWGPLQPKHLDFENTQFLLIGESSGIENALQEQPKDKENDTEDAKTEMEKLEGEDEIRIKHLKGDDAIFADLGVSKKEYSLQTTWD